MTKKTFAPVIERGIPLPINSSKKGYSGAIREMKPGDSMWFPTNSASLRALGRKFFGKGCYAARDESKDLEAGARIWRLR